MEFFDLAVLFTAAGAVVGGALVKTLVSAGKAWGLVPEHGRGVLYAVALLSLGLIGLAALDASFLRDGITGQDILTLVLAWAGLYAASVGVHETTVKAQAVLSARTDPTGPDVDAAG